jgi:hypothetical protein
MRKRAFRLRTVLEGEARPLVVLTYNLQDVQPWKQRTPRFQTAVYEADAAGLATTTLVAGPIEHGSEEQARQGHAAIVAGIRKGQLPAAPADLAATA